MRAKSHLNYKGGTTKSQSRTEYLQGLCNGRLIRKETNSNERNENSRPIMNIMGDKFVSSQKEKI